MSTTGSITLLIAALRADTDPTDWSQQSHTADTEKLAVSAIVLGVAPLLHWQLSVWNVSLAPRADAKLLAARRASAARQHAIELQLSEILAVCAPANIPLIILKGAYLAAHVYPDVGLRPMNDIDVLLRPADLPAMESLLTRLGYVGEHKDPERGARVTKHVSTFRKPHGDAATPNPYLSADGERTVEPHISLEESWFGLRADITPGVWERSVAIDYHGHAARALCPSDLLLHLCIHLTFHLIMGRPSIVQLVDLLMVSQRMSNGDWSAVAQRARERNATGYIYAALQLAQFALAAPIPDDVLRDLANATPAPVRAHAETISLDDVMQRTQQPPLTTLRQRLLRGVHDRAETARWAGTLGEQWNVWRTLLDVTRTDAGQMIGDRIRGRNSHKDTRTANLL